MVTTNRLPTLILSLFLILQLLSLTVSAQECTKTKLCATGCCSKDGFCGTTKEHCGSGCRSTCDFKLGCDKSNPCKGGTCCSKFGFCGFGPDFCSKDNCVAGCDAKAYCDPGGYGSEYAEHTKCPLNVCCSKWGYCGLTEEFCGKKKVNRPSCLAKGLPMKRVVGYYEGWATGRACDQFKPSDIPDGVYTHLNFAFASIDPRTFQVVPAANGDTELYRQLARKKRVDANLKVFLAIGGWAFNDPGPTATTFSDIARSEANQRAFISSLVSLMNTYNFDGVDIDWEYPEAPDRQGRGEDFTNLPIFLRNIKSSLTQNGDKNGLSIAVPASYWYLRHFDIINIAKHVDFFNVMTYDLHGSWHTPESWLGSHLNSHTNLTEIEDALDLLWRNKIDPDQVNLGLAFYSRTFTASDPGCMSPGCLFTSGAAKGPCSDAVGVLSNAEIDRKVSMSRSSVSLDQKAAAKILKRGRDWMTYDDADTWKIKLDFARGQCLGGAMVWAISQDTSDGKYSKQLQSATGYKSRAVTTIKTNVNVGIPGGVFKEMEVSEPSSDVSKKQCRWSNCGQGCPSGWKGVPRIDPYKHSIRELMYDNTGCDGSGTRIFCCPPGDQPTCQWLYFNGGKCSPGCPGDSDMEVASTKAGCNNGKAQVACCKGDASSMDIYRQCRWHGKEHDCAISLGTKSCSWSSTYNMPLFSSGDGSGAQVCRDSSGRRGRRPYCCDESDSSKAHWNNCQWYDNFALGLTPYAGEKTCNANCPAGKIKIALDKYESLCDDGTSAYCCDAEVKVSADEKKKTLGETLKAWAKAPTCPNTKGRLSSHSGSGTQGDKTPTVVKRNVPQVSAADI
ncbi:glycoside hydrolase superfamily [Dactylonectria estremocensis]|uniref:chitinase n=1 Tax=Dactylonectria estremocensis TaxID=1079267 RepID=A0A9P9EML1_9HYPO|nr:glycoside hydrolase superfamily [Dactylonectria estremocensis]